MTKQQPCGQVLIHRRFYLDPDGGRATLYVEQTWICITEEDARKICITEEDARNAQDAFERSPHPQDQADRLKQAVGAYLTDSTMHIFQSCWKTDTQLSLLEAGKAIADFNEKLNNILEDQIKTIGTWSGVPTAIDQPIAGIAANYFLRDFSGPLKKMSIAFEATGLAVGLHAGQPKLAIECAKGLAHDVIETMVNKYVDNLIPKSGVPSKAEPPDHHSKLMSPSMEPDPTVYPDPTDFLGP